MRRALAAAIIITGLHILIMMKPRTHAVVIALYLMWGCRSDAGLSTFISGDTVTIVGEVSGCVDCVLFDSLYTIGTTLSDNALSIWTNVAVGDGFVVAAPLLVPAAIAVFTADGSAHKIIERNGEGPGEFKDITDIAVDRLGRIYVLDRGTGRVTVLNRDFSVRRSITPQLDARTILIVRDSTLALTGIQSRGIEMGRPVHFLDAEGKITTSAGAMMGPYRADRAYKMYRRTAGRFDGTIAIAKAYEYEIELVRPDSTSLLIRREVAWFPAWDSATAAPSASVGSVWFGPNNTLWTTVGRREGGPTSSDDLAAVNDQLDFLIEVFDVATGRLIASQWHRDDLILGSSGLLLAARQNDDGLIFFVVYRPTLASGGQS
jgi:hypothetical protein